MKYQYKKLGRNSLGEDIIPPVIPIKLKNGEREILINAGTFDFIIMQNTIIFEVN